MNNSNHTKNKLDEIRLEIILRRFFRKEGVLTWVRLKEGKNTMQNVDKLCRRLAAKIYNEN